MKNRIQKIEKKDNKYNFRNEEQLNFHYSVFVFFLVKGVGGKPKT